MESVSNTPYYYDMQARIGSLNSGVLERFAALEAESMTISTEVKTLEEGLLKQALALEEECRRRRHQIKKVRHELGLRIQELEVASDTKYQHVLKNIDGILAEYDRRLEALAADYEATLRELTSLRAQVSDNAAAIEAERKARITADDAESKTREELSAKVDSNTANIEAVREALSDASQVAADDVRKLQAYIGDLSEAEIQDALNEADGQARRRLKLARAEEELAAKIEDGNKASAEYRRELLTLMESKEAEYTQKINAVSDDLKAEVTSRENLSSQVDSNTAAIREEASTRSAADSAYATRISTLESTVTGHTSSITTLNEVRDGVSARSFLRLDTNGYVSGIESYNGGEKNSSFIVTADKFKIVPPNTTNPKDIFEYDSATQKLKVKNIVVDGADIKEATIGKATIINGAVIREKILDGAVTAVNLVTEDKFPLPAYGANTWATCYPPAGEAGGRMLIILSFTLSCPASSSRIKAQAVIHLGDRKINNPTSEIHDIRDMYEFTDSPLMEYKEDEYWTGSHTFTFITKWTRTDTSVMPITALIAVYYENDTAVCSAKQTTLAMSVMSLHR